MTATSVTLRLLAVLSDTKSARSQDGLLLSLVALRVPPAWAWGWVAQELEAPRSASVRSPNPFFVTSEGCHLGQGDRVNP